MIETNQVGESSDVAPFRVRPATTQDARSLVSYLGEILSDPMASIPDLDEMGLDIRSEEEFLRRIGLSELAVALVAEHEGEIVGLLTCQGGKRRKIRHVAEIGMSVRADWRRRGVASALLARVETWARETGRIKKLALNVFEGNQAAVKLYQKAGYQIEGSLRNQINLGDRYVNLILMGKILD